MQVTFTCEKCGFVQGIVTTIPGRSRDETIREFMDDGLGECPNCAKLTYGPLTEGMVAEAMFVAGHQWARDRLDAGEPILGSCDPYLQERRMDMARFVLRLLNAFGDKRKIRDDGTGFASLPWDFRKAEPGTTWRNWLLDLARQK